MGIPPHLSFPGMLHTVFPPILNRNLGRHDLWNYNNIYYKISEENFLYIRRFLMHVIHVGKMPLRCNTSMLKTCD